MEILKLPSRKTLAIILFCLSLLVHLINFHAEGRTWDEPYKVDHGFLALRNLAKLDLRTVAWQPGNDHPIVGKYIYGLAAWPHFHKIKNPQAPSAQEIDFLLNNNYVPTYIADQLYLVDYDLTGPRLVATVANSVIVVLTFLIASSFLSPLISLIAGFVLLTTPLFLAMGRLATFESLSGLFFTLIVIGFYRLIHQKFRPSSDFVFLGLITGLLIWTRYNNIQIFLFLPGFWLIVHYFKANQKWKKMLTNKKFWEPKLLLIPITAFILGVAIWPYVWPQFPKYLLESLATHKTRPIMASFYHWRYLFYTTPAIYFSAFVLGLVGLVKKFSSKKALILWWLTSVLIFFYFFSSPRGGPRYAYVIYPAYAITVALGFKLVFAGFKKINRQRAGHLFLGLLTLVATYQLYWLFRINPYYLDYYSEFVGGVQGAVNKNLHFSYWGEGQREVGLWLNQKALIGSSVSLEVTPKYVFPKLRPDLRVFPYGENIGQTDYLVVTRRHVGELSQEILNKYQLVYSAQLEDEPLVSVYQRRH